MATFSGKVVKKAFTAANGKVMARIRDAQTGKFYTLTAKKGSGVDFKKAKEGTDVVVVGTPISKPSILREQDGTYHLSEGYTKDYEDDVLVIKDKKGNVVAKISTYDIVYASELSA